MHFKDIKRHFDLLKALECNFVASVYIRYLVTASFKRDHFEVSASKWREESKLFAMFVVAYDNNSGPLYFHSE